MINVRVQHQRIHSYKHLLVFVFDGGFAKYYEIEIAGPARGVRAQLDYWINRKYKHCVRDWLFMHRGQFGSVERTMERILFRLIKG